MKTLKDLCKLVFVFSVLLLNESSKAQTGWVLQPSIGPYNFSKIKFINPSTGFLTGYTNKIFKTTNSGATWSEYIVGDSVNDLKDIFFVNQTTGFVVGGMVLVNPSLFASSIILKTTNTGSSWFKVYYDTSQAAQKHFSTVYFPDENTGYAGGGLYASGTNYLFKTTNGGNNWTEVSYTQPGFPQGMYFNNSKVGVTVFFSGISKTTDGGSSWSQVNSSAEFLFGLFFVNSSTGYACGGDVTSFNRTSLILKTTDGGSSWQNNLNESGNGFCVLNSIVFTDVNTGYSVGGYFPGKTDTSYIILKTTDQGANWGFQASPSDMALLSVEFINIDVGFAVGRNGTILKTTDGGGQIVSSISNFSSEIPGGFVLHQNFPNPFNPSTVIRYAIPNRQLVSLTVFDVLGKKIESLVSEVQNAGTYEVNWNAGNYPSGIYYYKFETENFNSTKRMLLVK